MRYPPHFHGAAATTALLLFAVLLMCKLGATPGNNLCMEFKLVRDSCNEVLFYCGVIISQWLVGLTEYDKLCYFTLYQNVIMFLYVLFKKLMYFLKHELYR